MGQLNQLIALYVVERPKQRECKTFNSFKYIIELLKASWGLKTEQKV